MRRIVTASALAALLVAACSPAGAEEVMTTSEAIVAGVVSPVVAPVVRNAPELKNASLAGIGESLPQPPTSLDIGALSLSMPIAPVGLAADGTMALPESAQIVGWYQNGAVPGAREGNIVVAAHVDDAEVGLGPFARLRDLGVGDEIRLGDAMGRQFVYRVTSIEQTHKADVDPAVLFADDLAPRLALVTCGGTWDAKAGHYQDNVIVWAELTEQGP